MKTVESSACNVAFGQFIKLKRLKKEISQAEVAAQIGVTQSLYSRIEAGDRSVDLAMMINLCNFLGINPNEFLAQYIVKSRRFLKK